MSGLVILKKNNKFAAQINNLQIIEDILQGRVKSPTGGESPRIRLLADRSGEIPGPTVKVWMEEEFLVDFPLIQRDIFINYNSRPDGSLRGFYL